MKIKIKYLADIEPIEKIAQGDWIDLRAAEDIEYENGQFFLIPLGVAMEIPKGYEAHLVPRSSTFKNYGLVQTNSVGIIDNSYSGNGDEWRIPVYATKFGSIKKNERVCQFRIVEKMPEIEFDVIDNLEGPDRGGFGSTGR